MRVQWTHHSTALEGNSLTLGDTAFVLQEGLAVGGKPLKDHLAVIGHAKAIDLLYALIDRQKQVTADDVHSLHKMVQVADALDASATIRRWKIEANGTTATLSSHTQQWHEYARPDDIPLLMGTWLQDLDGVRQTSGDCLDAYTDLHLGFAAIHPYADGNGRLARLLANIPVIEGGAPPILVPQDRRRDYIMLMGDWSIARGAPRPGEPLVHPLLEREALRAFFEEVAQPARDLVGSYRKRQSLRGSQGVDLIKR